MVMQKRADSRIYSITDYGADPTGNTDSTAALSAAISDAFKAQTNGFLMEGIANLGGAWISLEGGIYLISRPLRFPRAGAGNFMVPSDATTAAT